MLIVQDILFLAASLTLVLPATRRTVGSDTINGGKTI